MFTESTYVEMGGGVLGDFFFFCLVVFVLIAQVGKLKGIDTFNEDILCLYFLSRWFILIYSIVSYCICHFIFREKKTENGELR